MAKQLTLPCMDTNTGGPELLPVILWIHGGAFVHGCSASFLMNLIHTRSFD